MNDAANPLVSVVIPTYNHARYLARALQSVIDQTYTNWEAIVIDNHSTDNTDEVMASFTDSRITYLKIHNNGVIAASRNLGIRAAKGEWVAFLDSDDWWVKDKLRVCFGCINDKVDLVYHDLEIISNQPRRFRRKIIKSRQLKMPVLNDLLLKENPISTSSVVVRIALLHQVNGMDECPEMIAAEDYNSWLRIARLTNKFIYLSERLGFYELHQQGISSERDMSIPTRLAVIEFFELLDDEQRKKIECHLSYARGRYNYLTGSYIEAKDDLLLAIIHCNQWARFKAFWMLALIYFRSEGVR